MEIKNIQISPLDFPPFGEIERSVQILGNRDVMNNSIYYYDYKVTCAIPPPPAKEWKIDNSTLVYLIDDEGNKIPNPSFEELKDENGEVINEKDRYRHMGAYDYFKMQVEKLGYDAATAEQVRFADEKEFFNN